MACVGAHGPTPKETEPPVSVGTPPGWVPVPVSKAPEIGEAHMYSPAHGP